MCRCVCVCVGGGCVGVGVCVWGGGVRGCRGVCVCVGVGRHERRIISQQESRNYENPSALPV